MRYERVYLDAIGYTLAPNVVTSDALEARLAPLYDKLKLTPGQLVAWTGIRERRWWDKGFRVTDGAVSAAEHALDNAGIRVADLGAIVYGGVCREHHEPATACGVAAALGASTTTAIFDVSNACIGALNGLLLVANMIELGQIRAGLVVSCESAREINDLMIQDMLEAGDMERFKSSLATLTGGSGAVAMVLSDGTLGHATATRHKLVGGVLRSAAEHHGLCRWGAHPDPAKVGVDFMETDAVGVLKHGVALGVTTWNDFLPTVGWGAHEVDRVICHQVGSANRQAILSSLGIAGEKDFTTYEHLGNIGTVSLPLTAAIADEREVLRPGDRVSFLGIGSGLNCLMLGWEW
jgi:3-oxoacyl-[acyl-carrier-protein] synthase III